jgi:Regulator of chromosome condensation (RCC1) repeat
MSLRAGSGCSAIIGSDGSLWVWGSNEHNRLGMNREGLFCLRSTVKHVDTPTRMRRNQTQDIVLGEKQTLVVTTAGQAIHLNGPNAGLVNAFHGPIQVNDNFFWSAQDCILFVCAFWEWFLNGR